MIKSFFFKNFKWNLINFWTQYKLASIFSDYLKKNDYDISTAVFYSYWFHKSAILLAILKDKRIILEFVSRAHSIDLYHHKWGIINEQVKVPPYKIFKLKHVDTVYSVSKHGEHFLKQRFPEYRNKFKTAYLGIIDDIKTKMPVIDDNFHIVTCSDIDINKRVHKLAEALNEITYPIKWTHFGDGSLIKELEKQMKLKPKNVIIELKGRIPNRRVKQYYADNKINLFVNLSIVEGLPVSIMEAMMFEIPILATSVYGTPEAVIEGENGFLLDVNFRIEDLVSKINYCLTHRKDLEIMGRKSREIYLDKYNAEKNYSEFANCLKTL
jgi:colanic acid/amylovoran biosynthesis glycosyltransferase